MARTRVLTDREREIIKRFLSDGTQLEGFRALKWLLKRWDRSQITEDLDLIDAFLKSA